MQRVLSALMGFAVMTGMAGGEPVPPAFKSCRAISDDHARLACYDAAAGKPEAAPAAAALKNTPPEFGGENLRRPEAKVEAAAALSARITKIGFNAIGHFTLTLDNGQVWRQLDADTATARLKPGAAVTIKRGFMDAYSLSADGVWGIYKVKRIQ